VEAAKKIQQTRTACFKILAGYFIAQQTLGDLWFLSSVGTGGLSIAARLFTRSGPLL
jgi:hypothetical protein